MYMIWFNSYINEDISDVYDIESLENARVYLLDNGFVKRVDCDYTYYNSEIKCQAVIFPQED